MTSEGELQKTSEFLRRRKLRLQQVREQSKDIAKIIRQRAKVEKLRQVVELDARKEKDYLQHQEKVVKKLEQLYSKGLAHVGTSHKDASDLTQPGHLLEGTDLSRRRGKEATAELKRKQQQKLDERKKSLDRKVQAREAANVISREKSTTAANKLSTKPSSSKFSDESKSDNKSRGDPADKSLIVDNDCGNELPNEVTTNDMATQWDAEILPNEWEPHVPALVIPKDDSTKGSLYHDTENISQKQRRPNLFALSDEMPSSLRGSHQISETVPSKPSLTLVSEYIQNRALRLREPEMSSSSKKQSEDLQTLKQTILRTRSSKTEGSAFSNICHVLEGQVIPVPTWHAETGVQYSSTNTSQYKQYPNERRQFANVTNSEINKIFSSIRPGQSNLTAPAVSRRIRPSVRKYSEGQKQAVHPSNDERLLRGNGSRNELTKKKSVTMYNHCTKDARDVPCAGEQIVFRDAHSDKDAYSEALDEAAASDQQEKQNKKIQDITSKLAVTRQNVDKEYQDTMAFLNGLPRNKGAKAINIAYKDDRRLQMQKESRQRVLQQEFINIEKESGQQGSLGSKAKSPVKTQRKKSKSPSAVNFDDNFNARDFQYSWMPVPESDGNLAVHTIPTAVKEGKSGNSVKFSKVDSYHEYRSRHKHTPPTKDTNNHEKRSNTRYVETVIIQQQDGDSSSASSVASDNSCAEELRVQSENSASLNETSKQLTDSERIIIYKILDYKNTKSGKSAKKIKVDRIQSSKGIAVEKKNKSTNRDKESQVKQPNQDTDLPASVDENPPSVENLDPSEGIYKVDSEKGLTYNVFNCSAANVEPWQLVTERKPWWDNITSMYYSDSHQEDGNKEVIEQSKPTCSCNEKYNAEKQFKEGPCKNDGSNNQQLRRNYIRFKCKCVDKSTSGSHSPIIDPAMNTSAISFKTATNTKPNGTPEESGYIKLIDEVGKETGNIFIGATGFLKDDAYEVVIQLRKKGIIKEETKKHDDELTKENLPSGKDTNKTEKTAVLSESADNIQSKATSIDQSPESIENPQISTVKQDPVIVSNVTTGNLGQNKENGEQLPKNSPLLKTAPTFRQHDRSVSTSFKDSYAIPSDVPKTDPIPRPATSSYTQTSSPPNSRPMLIHMSSSTSTAYMSPPEVVLPDFFRRGYESCNEAYQNIDDQRLASSRQKTFYKRNSSCRCKRCVRSTKEYLSKMKPELEVNQLKTPPNTARSLSTDVESDSLTIHKSKKGSSHSSPVSSIRCHKCKTKENSKFCCKYHSQKNKYQFISNKKVLLTRSTRSASLYSRKSRNNCNAIKNTNKSYLNPMIKDYINKLLSLNQEGIKAIQIVNQECSSVNTPASSIINVPSNVCSNTTDNDALKNKISLEQIKHVLRGQFCYALRKRQTHRIPRDLRTDSFILKSIKSRRKHLKKKTHKVKSLNISKRNRIHFRDRPSRSFTPVNTSARESARNCRPKTHNVISSARNESNRKFMTKETKYDDTSSMKKTLNLNNQHPSANVYEHKSKNQHRYEDTSSEQPKTIISSGSATPNSHIASTSNGNPTRQPISTSTQTSGNINNDMNFMKLAEDKLQNMEKIADLTEKCTKRLSNLAKVLEEVRKNKSLAYSQVSTSESTDSDQKSDRVVVTERNDKRSSNSVIDLNEKTEIKSPTIVNSTEGKHVDSKEYESLLLGIPKPGYIKHPHSVDSGNGLCCANIIEEAASKKTPLNTNVESRVSSNPKCRSKPPPALLRIHLKRPQENVVPHELSTVIEVDSPMSVKLKNQSSNIDNAIQSMKNSFEPRTEEKFSSNITDEEHQMNPVLRQSISTEYNNSKIKIISTDSSDESKLRMMDLNQFNEIMLRPFISLQQYTEDYYEDDLVTKRESVSKDTGLIDDISSLHSDGSLPDVVAELLKRKLITEPFKFDNASNVNSTTVSSESTLSVLALSKARRDKTKSKIIKNKENIAETSDALSISSNPDLENAFKKLGMGWASSTLKKTKERLALSSSSNTSSSSLSQFKFKNSTKQDMPTIVTDSVSSVPNLPKKPVPRYLDTSKNAEQQTSFTNSMTVKEFLTNELAKKITFTNKSSRNETNEEFVSLLETKMPEELKTSSRTIKEENSGDSIPSGNNNRARTSTPVQIFKSVTYHSSSSSNVSNGLFSNADDLSSVKLTSTSMRNHSTSEKDELTIPNYSLKKMRKPLSDCSKTDSC